MYGTDANPFYRLRVNLYGVSLTKIHASCYYDISKARPGMEGVKEATSTSANACAGAAASELACEGGDGTHHA